MNKAKTTETQSRSSNTDVRLRGRVLLSARLIWLAFALFNLILMSINVLQPFFGGTLCVSPFTLSCSFDTQTLSALRQAHISLPTYTHYLTLLGFFSALLFIGLSVLLFGRAFDQVAGMFASFCFLLLGLQTLAGDVSHLPTALQVYVNMIQTLVFICCLGFFLVTFPNGRFVPRWSWLIGCTLFVQAILFMLPGHFNILSWPLPLILIEIVFAYTSPVALQIYRYRRIYTPAQRRQTRWVIFGLACFLLVFFVSLAMSIIPIVGVGGSLLYLMHETLLPLAFSLIPLSVTIAILRSRLWDIDVIIRRTLVYSTLTVILALLYLGLVIGLGSLVRLLTGQAGQSPVIIVASTLVIAALVQPLRHRIQAIIDRRFYRRKYNTARTLEGFSATLRNELDLNELREHLITVVQDTMQPSHVSLWLREPPDRKSLRSDRTQ
ncbi:MAG TPA: hypothetical protein VF043_33330 [Ktedonobacteraceae bacterium]